MSKAGILVLWIMCCFVVFVSLMCFGGAVHADDFYVDGGGMEHPRKTINYAFDHVTGSSANRHTIHVASAMYSENVVMDA